MIRRIGFAGALTASCFMVFVAQATAASFSNTTAITIPAGAPTTTMGPASPYPSPISVTGLSGTTSKLTVGISGLSHTVAADVGVVLVAPGGQALMLMNCSGGDPTLAPVNLVFDDQAATQLAQAPAPTSGSFKPTDHCAFKDEFDPPGPGTAYSNPGPRPSPPFSTLASTFNGLSPNGTWKLFVQDFSGGDVGTIAGGWTLGLTSATTVPTTPSGPTGDRAAAKKHCKKFKHNKKKRKKCLKRAKRLPV
jgi:subtilisin-like proprotein convertase family protein